MDAEESTNEATDIDVEALRRHMRRGSYLCFATVAAAALVVWALLWRMGLSHQVIEGQPVPPDGYCEASPTALPEIPDESREGRKRWAAALVDAMTLEEKKRMVRGVGWNSYSAPVAGYYVGSVYGIPRLGIPSIGMQDAAQGFRTIDPRMIGEVTAWPCSLAFAATWDPNVTERWAAAMGREFRAKGATMVLGPAVEVHRVALNGRNAEYLSGEDPYLGSPLTAAYVRGMQEGAGVGAVVKHWVVNSQETNRQGVNSVVDERTLWEQYYPPYEAAVAAGVAAVMCSYNFVNGNQSCANRWTLTEHLKGAMGFDGFVMSDWWALQTEFSAEAGTDQVQPGWMDGSFGDDAIEALPPGRLDDMVARVLNGMSRSREWRSQFPPCRVGCNCDSQLLEVKATSQEHAKLARDFAAASAVLLKNDEVPGGAGRRTLPLRRGQTVAVVGSACDHRPQPQELLENWIDGSYYTVGGSGRVIPPKTVSILEGLQGRGITTRFSASSHVSDVVEVMRGADVVLICGGATTTESVDRTSLALDQDHLIKEAAAAAHSLGLPSVVVALAPGSITAGWRHKTTAALALFLPGQEAGSAVADVLLGDVVPSGKLPVTFPESEQDAIRPCAANPCVYAEGVEGGWHVYAGRQVAFPFGHGLSYTTFSYSGTRGFSLSSASLSSKGRAAGVVTVRNTGEVAGVEVVQLYVRYPRRAVEDGEPEMRLRAFRRTPLLAPGEACEVELALTLRDLSVWDADARGWRVVPHVSAVVAASSRDQRLCGRVGAAGDGAPPLDAC